MNRKDYTIVAWLTVLALFIWFRDTSWMSTSDDTLPILVAIPMFIWLAEPWSFKKDFNFPSSLRIMVCLPFFLIGVAIDNTFLLGMGWTILLWAWLSVRVTNDMLPVLRQLLVLPIMAFPWIALDAEPIGWYFRLSGAKATADLFSFLGFQVLLQGTHLHIEQMPISVEAACSGLNTLQSMLISGSVVAFILLGDQPRRYWFNLPFLVLVAWLANTVRIIVISAAAVLFGQEFAMGAFHDIGGWLILILMFCLCWWFFSIQEIRPTKSDGASKRN